MSDTPAGWYVVDGDPTTERFWDGTSWSDAYRPVGPVAPPPPFAGPMAVSGDGGVNASKPLWKKKRVLVPVGLVAAVIGVSALSGGGSGKDEEPAADTVAPLTGDADAEASEDAAEDVTDAAGEAAAGAEDDAAKSDETDAGADLGTRENPYPFGQTHVREPGALGAGWTISIEEVRTEGIAHDEFFAEDGETRTCVAVVGTATLDTLDSEELTSNIFSFPEPVLIVNGAKASQAIVECNTEALKAEGLTWRLDVSLAPGGTVKWFEVYLVDSVAYDTVAIESTVYAAP